MKIIWTDLAIEDLRSIHDYISKDSKFYADRFIEKLLLRVEQLKNYPKSGRKVPEIGDESIRELIEGNYRIIYRVYDQHVGVTRIHHASRILKNLENQ